MSLLTHLNTLESAGLLRLAQLEPDVEYLFRHQLVQEAAYASLLTSDRTRLHRAVGMAVERLYPGRLEELAPFLAPHFEKAGDSQRAWKYYRVAGKKALASYANREAEFFFRKALALTGDPLVRATIGVGLGEALTRQSQYSEAIRVWQSSINTYRELGELDQVAHLYASMARAAWYKDDVPGSLEICLQGLKVVEGISPGKGLATLLHETGRSYFFNGMQEEAVLYCNKALEAAEALAATGVHGAEEVQADTLATIGVLPKTPAPEARLALEKSISIAKRTGNLQIAHRAYHNLANLMMDAYGDMESGQRYYQKALEISRKRGTLASELLTMMNLIGIEFNRGRLDGVRAMLVEMQEKIATLPDEQKEQLTLDIFQMYLEYFDGNTDQALTRLRLLRDQAERRGNLEYRAKLNAEIAALLVEEVRWGRPIDWEEAEAAVHDSYTLASRGIADMTMALSMLVTFHARRQELDAAGKYLAQLESSADPERRIWDRVNLYHAHAELALTQGDWETAITNLGSLAELFFSSGRMLEGNRSLLYQADALLRRGTPPDVEEATALLTTTRSNFEAMGTRMYVDITSRLQSNARLLSQAQAQENQQVILEMAAAGRLQERFLPRSLPNLPGWDFSGWLDPARQTSGDFYDFINLPGGKVGVVIADVADKGAGAALFMTLTRSLLRTYATEFPGEPERVLLETNRRILADTDQALFVTLVYGVLDPASGSLLYASAGHNPPYLLRASETLDTLPLTGIPLGVQEDSTWESRTINLAPGDTLVLYTDGVTEAQNLNGEYFGEARIESAMWSGSASAEALQQAIVYDLAEFVGAAPQMDDITLVVIRREY